MTAVVTGGAYQTAYNTQAVIAKDPPPEGTCSVKLTVTLSPANYFYEQTFDFSLLKITQVRAIKIYNPDPNLPLTVMAGINQIAYVVPAGGGATITTESAYGNFIMGMNYPSAPAQNNVINFILFNYYVQPDNWVPAIQINSSGGVPANVNAYQGGSWLVGVTGTPAVSQSGAWSVAVNNLPASQPVTGTFWQASQPVTGTFWQVTQPVSQSGTWTVTEQGAASTKLDITAATLVKSGAGRLWSISTIVNGSTIGTANDSATTGGAAVANQLCQIDDTSGDSLKTFPGGFPFTNGLVIVPGTGQTLVCSYT